MSTFDIVVLKTPPAEVFTTSSFIGALLFVDTTIASVFVAAAVLIIAPKFLVSVIPSSKTIKGFLVSYSISSIFFSKSTILIEDILETDP